MLLFEAEAHFIIWLAADHVREMALTRHQVEAALAHELCHVGADEKGNPALVGHDVEEFGWVVQNYGLWKQDVLEFARATRQLALELG